MTCPKCGVEQADGNRSCQSCGRRLTELEWSLSGWTLGSIVCALLLIGGMAGWFFFGRSKSSSAPVQSTPAAQTQTATISPPAQPRAEKPSAATPADKPPVPLTSAPESSGSTPYVTEGSATHPLGHSFGPFAFRLAAHQRRNLTFHTPADLLTAQLRSECKSTGGVGAHLRVKILHNAELLYDSGNIGESQFRLRLPRGQYVLVAENTAVMLSRNVTIKGEFTAIK